MGLRNFLIGLTIGVAATTLITYYEYLRHRLHFGVSLALCATIFIYILPPIFLLSNCYIRRHIIFLPFVLRPFWVNFNDPKSQGLEGTRNLYLSPEPGITVGVWHILPGCLVKDSVGKKDKFWDEALKDSGKPIIIYLHGTSASRALWHRKELYRLMQSLDCHVLALDYRGYADSSRVAPYETGVVMDSSCLFKWVVSKLGNRKANIPVFVWGHSLGTGIACHMVSDLIQAGESPTGLFLESPFSNLGDEFKYHWLSVIYRWIPGFIDHFAVKPLKMSDIAFESDVHIANITIPILIMHAAEDLVVPYFLGQKLYKAGVRKRPITSAPICFKHFSKEYEHRYIVRSPELPKLVMTFMECSFVKEFNCETLRSQSTEWNYKNKRRDPSRVVKTPNSLTLKHDPKIYY